MFFANIRLANRFDRGGPAYRIDPTYGDAIARDFHPLPLFLIKTSAQNIKLPIIPRTRLKVNVVEAGSYAGRVLHTRNKPCPPFYLPTSPYCQR